MGDTEDGPAPCSAVAVAANDDHRGVRECLLLRPESVRASNGWGGDRPDLSVVPRVIDGKAPSTEFQGTARALQTGGDALGRRPLATVLAGQRPVRVYLGQEGGG